MKTYGFNEEEAAALGSQRDVTIAAQLLHTLRGINTLIHRNVIDANEVEVTPKAERIKLDREDYPTVKEYEKLLQGIQEETDVLKDNDVQALALFLNILDNETHKDFDVASGNGVLKDER